MRILFRTVTFKEYVLAVNHWVRQEVSVLLCWLMVMLGVSVPEHTGEYILFDITLLVLMYILFSARFPM